MQPRVGWAVGPLLLAGSLAPAADFQPRAGVGVTYSDNVNRLASGRGDTVVAAEAGLNYVNSATRWNAALDANLTHMEFLDHTYKSQTLGSGTGTLGLSLVPQRLSWDFLENYGQVATDPFGAVVPSDRQNISYFTTGPNLTVPMGINHFNLQARYSSVGYSASSVQNSQRFSGTAAFVHQMTDIRSIGFNVFGQRTDYSHPELFRDNSLRSAFLSLVSAPRRGQYEFDVGATQLDDGVSTHSAPLFTVELTHRMTGDSTINFYGRRGYSDSADTFRFDQSGPAGGASTPGSSTNVQVLADTFRETRGELSYTVFKPRDTIRLSAYWVAEKYVNNRAFDRRRYGADLDVGYVLSPQLRLDTRLSLENDSADALINTNRNLALAVVLTDRLTRSVDVSLRVQRYRRQSDLDPFTENRVTLFVTYAPARRRGATPTPGFDDRARDTNSRATTQQQLQRLQQSPQLQRRPSTPGDTPP